MSYIFSLTLSPDDHIPWYDHRACVCTEVFLDVCIYRACALGVNTHIRCHAVAGMLVPVGRIAITWHPVSTVASHISLAGVYSVVLIIKLAMVLVHLIRYLNMRLRYLSHPVGLRCNYHPGFLRISAKPGSSYQHC